MAVPKKKVSISRKKIRHTHIKEQIKQSFCHYAKCNECGILKKKHSICVSCGHYSTRAQKKTHAQ
jgi:ribosomal protein L32